MKDIRLFGSTGNQLRKIQTISTGFLVLNKAAVSLGQPLYLPLDIFITVQFLDFSSKRLLLNFYLVY